MRLQGGTNSKKEDYDQSTTQQQLKRLHYSNRTETKRKRAIATFATLPLGRCPTRKTGRSVLRKTSLFPHRIYKKGVIRNATKIQQTIQSGKIRAHIIRRKDGLYLIRCQINKVRISVAASQLDYCKERFIEKLHEKFEIITLNGEKKGKKGLTPLVPYMETWLENAKKPFIKESTYIDYVRMMKAYIVPAFKGKYIERIRALELQSFLTDISNSGRTRTAKKVYLLLSPMFDFAIADGLITLNPIAKVKLARYDSEHGVPLTRE